ncbi:PREDICTED: DNA-directed RNA polymerase III subunit RPC10 [Nicrophorus vespilloides]|uniref:DNA-directed RNA polymerase subunit n=1 Tax=Nicrophorus vespilloides TaxID=110193 RepID=A0ABM1NG68_NICVS|nr:PREDICTED: DNA-directed RNA polymerase III subunit RPC10 [Nicrophorus vespilloides]
MIPFCPLCGNLMFVQEKGARIQLVCNICPIFQVITKTVTSKTYYKLKEIDDVLGGAEAWKNVDSTEERCPKCAYPRAFFMQIQTRSADEPMTTFYRCCNIECSHNWRD